MIQLTSFHDYDIRGVYPTEINEEFYYVLGRAIATYIGCGPIAIGHDMRLSSPSLYDSLIKGIIDQGIDVVALGMISTEMHYFASGKYQFEANVVVSASHNPPQFNGVKIVKKGVVPLHGSYGLDELKKLVEKNQFTPSINKGSITKKDIFMEWIEHALSFVDTSKIGSMTVVVDGGNGMGGPAWVGIAKRLPQVTFIPLYLDPDGTFPHHLADPLKDENVADLKKFITEKKADLGIALDGDADRIFFFDENGDKLPGTITTAILTAHFLEIEKGPILYGAICGKIVQETIIENGGTPVRTRVGHSYIKEKMKSEHGLFAGEHSGHFYFGRNYNADSSLIAGLIMLQIVSQKKLKMSQIAKPYMKYVASGELDFVSTEITTIITDLEQKFGPSAQTVDYLDGLSIWYPNYWFNVRASKTEPLLRLNVEADSQEIMYVKLKELTTILASHGAKKKQ